MNLFPSYTNQIFWIVLGILTAAALVLPTAMIAWARTPYATGAGQPPVQPVKFDHRHHVRDDGVTCEYCHSGAFDSPHAGIPSTSLCMNCHAQIWPSSPELEPVRHSFFSDEPIHWERVNRLPDFVFFDHSAHVTHGVGCVTCHGRIDRMAQVRATQPLTMRWCMDCHRDPAPSLRPLDTITEMEWQPGPDFSSRDLQAQLGARALVHCSTCHR